MQETKNIILTDLGLTPVRLYKTLCYFLIFFLVWVLKLGVDLNVYIGERLDYVAYRWVFYILL